MKLSSGHTKLTDVEFILDDSAETIFGQSPIFAARSPVLASMFNTSFRESLDVKYEAPSKIMISDLSSSVFKEIMIFIYSSALAS